MRSTASSFPAAWTSIPCRTVSAPHALCDKTDRDRDRVELTLARWAMEDRKPVLGVCRGVQLINLAAGGTLYQDLAEQMPGSIKHDYFPFGGEHFTRDYLAHEVDVVADGTRLAGVFGRGVCASTACTTRAFATSATVGRDQRRRPTVSIEGVETVNGRVRRRRAVASRGAHRQPGRGAPAVRRIRADRRRSPPPRHLTQPAAATAQSPPIVRRKRIFITAAEASGDQHAAELVRSLKELDPSLEIEGLGGSKMAAAGVTLLAETVGKAAMGWRGALRAFEASRWMDLVSARYREARPDLHTASTARRSTCRSRG